MGQRDDAGGREGNRYGLAAPVARDGASVGATGLDRAHGRRRYIAGAGAARTR